MERRYIVALVIGLVVAASVVPALGRGVKITGDGGNHGFPVNVNFQPAAGGGGGNNNNPPIIVAKFEVAEDATQPFSYCMPTGHPGPAITGIDADPTEEGTQVDPPLEYDGYTWVGFYVFVRDPDSNDQITQVAVDVYHPNGSICVNNQPVDYNDTDHPLGDGSLKYDIVLTKLNKFNYTEFLQFIHDTVEQGGNHIIYYNPDYNWNDPDNKFQQLIDEINNCMVDLYYGRAKLHYCQPAGYYRVHAIARDIHGGQGTLDNCFEYVIGVGIETDFDSLDFGNVELCQEKWIYGDWTWGSGGPTIRNIGNWDVMIGVNFSDLGMEKSDLDGDGEVDDWNVVYDVRMGDWPGAPRGNRSWAEIHGRWINPYEEAIVPCQWYRVDNYDVLRMCNTTKISFAIHVLKSIEYAEYSDDEGLIISVYVPPYVYCHHDGLPECP